jgi:hypothetical protein
VRRNACVLACAGAVNGNVVSEQSLRIKAIPAIFPFGNSFPVWKKSTTAVFKALKRNQKVERSMKS